MVDVLSLLVIPNSWTTVDLGVIGGFTNTCAHPSILLTLKKINMSCWPILIIITSIIWQKSSY